jgi:PleD family two-component response regulator
VRRIYIAEDSPTQALRVRRILSSVPDCELTFFTDGLDIYLAVQQDPPDMLLLDLILPTLHGLAISRLLKFEEHYYDIPIIIFSSMLEDDIADQARNVGACAFIPKPFNPDDLLAEVAKNLKPSTLPVPNGNPEVGS